MGFLRNDAINRVSLHSGIHALAHGAGGIFFAAALGIVRYVQTHAGHDDLSAAFRASRGAPEAYDGVAEQWWRDRASFVAALGTPAGQQAGAELLADERRFIDLARSALFERKGPAHATWPEGSSWRR